MFRWPDKPLTILLAYSLVFLGIPALCVISYLWVSGQI